MSIVDENIVIAYIYWMFLCQGLTTDTFHTLGGVNSEFLRLMGKNPYGDDINSFDLTDQAQEIIDRYATKERIKIVFTPCDGSTKDKRNKKNRKYWVIESNDPKYPLGSKVKRDRVDELMKEFKASIHNGFGKCPTWCPHCHMTYYRVVNFWRFSTFHLSRKINNYKNSIRFWKK